MHWYRLCEQDRSHQGEVIFPVCLALHKVMSRVPWLVSGPQFERYWETVESAVPGAHDTGVEGEGAGFI